jgi:predicted DCC family thiol-disulfide oxidoreductase YuxK
VRGDREVVLLYDEDCGFCVWSAQKLGAWDRRRHLAVVAIQSEDGQRLLASIPPVLRLASMHVATPGGRVLSGGAAIPPVFRELPGGAPLARLAEAMPGATDRAHRWVARHRGSLGRVLGRASCGTEPGRAHR